MDGVAVDRSREISHAERGVGCERTRYGRDAPVKVARGDCWPPRHVNLVVLGCSIRQLIADNVNALPLASWSAPLGTCRV